MKGLRIYSIIIVAFSLVSLLIDILSGCSPSIAIDLWAVAFYTPVIYYLVKSKPKKQRRIK